MEEIQRHLTPVDVRRWSPDAYGRDYVDRRDDYLTSTLVTVFVLVASPAASGSAKDIKFDIRRFLGRDDALRNHLHMPDSPGDAFADLDHLTGTTTFRRPLLPTGVMPSLVLVPPHPKTPPAWPQPYGAHSSSPPCNGTGSARQRGGSLPTDMITPVPSGRS